METLDSKSLVIRRLNPYYNGRYSWSARCFLITIYGKVLILIIMEDTHGVNSLIIQKVCFKVLILIIMEDTHGALVFH